MQREQLLTFGSYRLDPHTGQLWRGKQAVRLTGKASALLCYVVERAGQLVTKAELFRGIWPQTVVSDAALTACIQELRRALRDNAKSPRYIETVHRRGFRFLPAITAQPVLSGQFSVVSADKAKMHNPPLATAHWQLTTKLVGREAELTQLHGWLAKALHGERQIVFVTGEPGIGKTALVEAFLADLGQRGAGNGEQKSQKSKIRGFSPAPSPQPLAPRQWLGWGQCIEHYGAGEAYLPVLEALGRMCRETDGERVITVLKQYAPSWLAQLPAVLNMMELEELQRRTAGVTRERMLRELAEALEVITTERPLVLVLEDLHWSDISTLDWLASVARRQERARLLIIGTYRPVEVLTRDHPLKEIKQELQLHGQCEELTLDFLSEADVAEYLTVRLNVPSSFVGEGQDGRVVRQEPDRHPPLPVPFPRGERRPQTGAFLQKLARTIHQRTDGNPLFMANVVNDLITQGALAKSNGEWELRGAVEELTLGTPENLRQLIEQQIAQVNSDERKILEAASVVGAEFSAAAVAAGAEQSAEAVEIQCDNLVRREQFLRTRGTSEWPDGTIATRYGFVHALYQAVLYEQIATTRRSRLHRQIGEREEQGYGECASEIAAELAVHFERGRDYRKAVHYLQHAGENAVQRSAHQEAIALLTKGLALLKTLPDALERAQQELPLRLILGGQLIITKGYAAPEVAQTYTQARALCQYVGEEPRLFPVLRGFWEVSIERAELQAAQEFAEQMLRLAERTQDSRFLLWSYEALGNTALYGGRLIVAHTLLNQALQFYHPPQHHLSDFAQDPGISCLYALIIVLWCLGYPDQALDRSQEALRLARGVGSPYDLVVALNIAVLVRQWRGDLRTAHALEAEIAMLANKHGFPHWAAHSQVRQGWVRAEQGPDEGALARIQEGMRELREMQSELARPYELALLAQAYGKQGKPEEGLQTVTNALVSVNNNGLQLNESWIYQLKGELTLQEARQKAKARPVRGRRSNRQTSKVTDPRPPNPDPQGEAEACFLKAIDIAREQQAKSWELQATTSLARLWQQQGKTKQAHTILSEIYNRFTEGFDTKDLQEAKALLEELS